MHAAGALARIESLVLCSLCCCAAFVSSGPCCFRSSSPAPRRRASPLHVAADMQQKSVWAPSRIC